MKKANNVQDVISFIKALPSMSHINPEDYAEVEGWADVVIQSVGKDLKATQLRKIFHYIKDLHRQFQKSPSGFSRAKVALITPSLAYAKGRGHIPNDFYELLTLCFGPSKCRSANDFSSAVAFLEAMMAFHKYHNPKQS